MRKPLWAISGIAILMLASVLSSPRLEGAKPKTRPTPVRTALAFDVDTRINTNSIEMFVYNDGNFAYDNANILGKTDGLYYPKGSAKTAVYSAGIWIGAKVANGIRIAMAEYSAEFVPGPMSDGTFQPDQDAFRVYRVSPGDTPASNPDYAAWPADQGAPVDIFGSPLITGDQMTWSVFNDADPAAHFNDAGGTQPLGVEIQHTVFGWNRYNALKNVYFMKYRIINRGSNYLDSTYVSIWSDPDLGNAADDLVGCDTLLSLGFCYNEGDDNSYGHAVPAVGFDFLLGPRVPSVPTDTAWIDGVPYPGYRILPMTSFNKYINGTDPTSSFETYGYMKGLTKDPMSQSMVPLTDPTSFPPDTTMFAVSGDPVTGNGWIDVSSADRRMMLNCGPFDMAPNDTQVVVVAVLIGQGNDPISSITALRQVDKAVQAAFDTNFASLNPPNDLTVYGRGFDQRAQLIWDSQLIPAFTPFPTLPEYYQFEGFNVYQGATANGPWQKIATFDEIDDVLLIYADIFNPVSGGIERVIVQNGTNTGLRYEISIDDNAFTGAPLINGQEYHFAVTGYYYDINGKIPFTDIYGNFLGYLTAVFETLPVTASVRPEAVPAVLSDTAAHVGGLSDAMVIAEILDPAATTGHEYRVTFNSDLTWNLQDLTSGAMLLQNQLPKLSGYDFPIIDGMMIRVLSPELGVRQVVETQNAFGPVIPPDNVHYSRNSTFEWRIDPLGDHSIGRYRWSNPTDDDYEIRFVESATERCFDWFGPDQTEDYSYVNPFYVPVQVWNIGIAAQGDPGDDFRITFMLLDDGDNMGIFDWGDGIYFNDIPYNIVNWNNPATNTGMYDPDYLTWSYRRFRFHRLDFYSEIGNYPAPGTIVQIITNKPAKPGDVFVFRGGLACGDVDASRRIDLADVVYLINYIFAAGPAPHGGRADVNCDNSLSIADAVYFVNYIFVGGMVPCAACW